jgi:hypothetical protein
MSVTPISVQEHEGEPEGEGERGEGEGEVGEGDRQGGGEDRPADDSLAEKQFKILVDLIDKVCTRIRLIKSPNTY